MVIMDEKQISRVVEGLKKSYCEIRQQCEEHLAAINENTAEVQSLFDYLNELDVKIERLAQRVDHLQMQQATLKNEQQIYPLNHAEKQIFLALYTEEMPLTLQEIAERTGIPLPAVHEHLTALAQKNIPITRTVANNQIFVKLNDHFKELQAKENVVNLSLTSFM
jgi:DNA-binding MarR family transcriptional regulator